MVLAGGAVIAAACSSSPSASSPDGSTSDDASSSSSGSSSGGSSGSSSGPSFCCNANPDPCCECNGEPQNAALCTASKECTTDGGTWTGSTCTPADSGPADVITSNFCCNANPDPCCPHEYCDAGITAECTAKLACEADGGNYNPANVEQPDGSYAPIGCGFSDGGLPDGEPGDAGGGG